MTGKDGPSILFQSWMDVFPITKNEVCDQELGDCKLKPNWVAERQALQRKAQATMGVQEK